MSKISQKAVKIDSNLYQTLTDWLSTMSAKNMGYHSKAQYVTESVRDSLEQHRGTKISYDELVSLLTKQENLINTLKKTSEQVDSHIAHVKKLELFWFKNVFPDIEIDQSK